VIVGEVVDDERRFTGDEQRRIAEQLQEVEAYLAQIQPLTAEQAKWLHVRIEFVTESATRLSVKDWKMQFVGVLTGIIVGLALDPSKVHELFAFIGRNVMPILGTIRGLLS